jgi:hypothetical protein
VIFNTFEGGAIKTLIILFYFLKILITDLISFIDYKDAIKSL